LLKFNSLIVISIPMKKRKTRKQEDEKTVACCQKLDFVFSQNPEPRTQNPEPRTQNPEPRTQNPEPRTQELCTTS
jgi:hypothetical protein